MFWLLGPELRSLGEQPVTEKSDRLALPRDGRGYQDAQVTGQTEVKRLGELMVGKIIRSHQRAAQGDALALYRRLDGQGLFTESGALARIARRGQT